MAVGQRFRKGARLFAVKPVRDPDETGRYLVCHCEEAAR
ncbi:head-tail adaptor [Pseudorhizobium tarimense]|uniref:Head-tail adaptor n=2 Tax=Pseudorhizobium tarimense TaxID=1079109 RepID=A0ABV2H097_9HYPH